jgi:hypothetical protein
MGGVYQADFNSNISFTAESLQNITGLHFETIELDESVCRAIHEANVERLTFGESVSIPNIAALQLGDGGPREIDFAFYSFEDIATTPYFTMLLSLSEHSNLESLSHNGGPFEFDGGALVPDLCIAPLLVTLNMCLSYITMEEWKEIWDEIAQSNLGTVRLELRMGIEGERMQAMRIVADTMQTNRSITKLDVDRYYRNEDVWKTSVVPFVERNVLAQKLDKLATEPDEELRAALVGKLLYLNRDKKGAFFQILTCFADVVVGRACPGTKSPSPVQDEGDQSTRRGRKRQAQA